MGSPGKSSVSRLSLRLLLPAKIVDEEKKKKAIFINDLIIIFCCLEVKTQQIPSYFQRLCTNLCCAPKTGTTDATCTWMGLAGYSMGWFPPARPEDSPGPLAPLAPLLALTVSYGHISAFSCHRQALRNLEGAIRLTCITMFSCCYCSKLSWVTYPA